VTGLSLKDDFCGMARSSSSKRSQKDASYLDSEDEVCDVLSSLRKENEELVDLIDNRDHMLREAKKLRKELRALLEDDRTRVAELETQVMMSSLKLILLRQALWFLMKLIVLIALFSWLIYLLLGKSMPPSVRN
jgi:hypothetical protein